MDPDSKSQGPFFCRSFSYLGKSLYTNIFVIQNKSPVKRAPIILTIGSLLLIAGSIFLYQTYFNRGTISVWNIIPDQAVLVYEAGECDDCTSKISKTVIGKLISELLIDSDQGDSLNSVFGFLSTPKKGMFVSLHVINKEDFDFIYYFPQDYAGKINTMVESWENVKGVRFSDRVLNNIKIQEFDFGEKKFTATQIEGIWVGSFTPFLVEDVIRTFTSEEQSLFIKGISEVYSLPRIKNDPGNIYIQLNNFMNWLKVFNESTSRNLHTLGQASLLDIKQNEGSIVLNGFSLTRLSSSETLLSYFKNQSPVQFTLKQYFSNRTVFAVNYGISDGGVFYNDLAISKNKALQDSLMTLVKFDYLKLFSSLGNELALCYQEARGGFSKVILFETANPNEWLHVFDQLSKVTEMEDTVFYEKYSTYEIREIEIYNLPGKLFSPLTSGFNQTYYTSVGNTIILAEQLEQLKEFVDDIDQEDVWGKSVATNKFLESTLLESNVSVYINTPLIWSTLSGKLNPNWRSFVSENQSALNAFGLGAIQFSHLNEGFYTNVVWDYSATEDKVGVADLKTHRISTNLTSSVIGKFFIVRSHVSKNDEVLVQDSTYMLYHLGSDGKVIWSRMLGDPIIGKVRQIDFYSNGKLQFFFATKNKLHVIDRLGNYVTSFPVEIRSGEIGFTNVVDYDNSRNYRFLISDKAGRVWMYDKGIHNLEGWKPKNLEGELFTEAAHHRIRGKDYLVAIRKDGMVYLMNRRGENIKGFPLSLEGRPDGNYYIEIGNAIATTKFVCITRDGFRLKFSMEGKILSRETLIRPAITTQFSLILEEHRKSYLIKRQDAKQLAILNEEGKEILLNTYVGTNPVDIKYCDFGAGKIYISITDLAQGLSFIYDGKGKLLTSTPIEGESIELRPSIHEMPKLFIASGKSLIIQE